MSGESSTTRIVALGVASCVESMEWGLTRPSGCAINKITKDSRYLHSPAFNVKRIREQIIFRASMTCLPSTTPCRKLVQPVIANFCHADCALPETVLLLYKNILQEWSYGQVVENPVKPRGVRPRHRSPIRWPSQAMGAQVACAGSTTTNPTASSRLKPNSSLHFKPPWLATWSASSSRLQTPSLSNVFRR